jgi:general secretion pathway protein G
MSGFCQVNSSLPLLRPRAGGYSLIEVLAVLVLLGAVSGLVFPRLVGIYDRFQERSQLEAVLVAVNELGQRAFSEQRLITLGPSADANRRQLGLVEGWDVTADAEIRWGANGACEGGELRIGPAYGEQQAYLLEPPFCRPRIQASASAGDAR